MDYSDQVYLLCKHLLYFIKTKYKLKKCMGDRKSYDSIFPRQKLEYFYEVLVAKGSVKARVRMCLQGWFS